MPGPTSVFHSSCGGAAGSFGRNSAMQMNDIEVSERAARPMPAPGTPRVFGQPHPRQRPAVRFRCRATDGVALTAPTSGFKVRLLPATY